MSVPMRPPPYVGGYSLSRFHAWCELSGRDLACRRHDERFAVFAREKRIGPRIVEELFLVRIQEQERAEREF